MLLPSGKLLRSFTLIELLLVVSIIAIVAGVTVPSFTGYMKNQVIKNAQEQFKNDLRSAQNLALTGSKHDMSVSWGSSSNGPARYWVVKWESGESDSSSYETHLVGDFVDAFRVTCTGLVSNSVQVRYSLPAGMTFKGPSGGCTECLFFSMLDGSTRYSGCEHDDADSVQILLQNENGGSTVVGWNRSGMIGNQ